MIAAQGEDQVLTRMELMAYSRGILNVMLLDADNEQYTREATPLQGLPEILGLWLDRVSAAAEIPTSVLFGRTPGGMNATGKEDRALWYDTVADYQQQELGPQIEKLSKIMLSASEIGGGEPETWSVVWLPLWAPTDAERTVTRLQQAQIDQIYAAMDGGLSGEEIIQSRFGGDEYSYDTHVDGEARGLLEAVEGTTSGNPGEGVSVPRRLDAARAAAVQAVVEAVVAGRLPAPQGRALLTVAHGLQEAEAALLCPDELEEKAEEAAEAQAEAMAPEAAGEESGDVEETKEPQGGETERGSAPANPPKKANFTADPTKQPAPEGD
jgi:hypothetical protein